MDLLLVIFGFICVILGILGSFLPILPGPILGWFGILLVYFAGTIEFNWWLLCTTFFVAALMTVLDYVLPAIGTKRFGGSKYGIWGANIGLIVGLIAPIPFGFVIGPFVGALVGELVNKSSTQNAFKAATGSFIGLMVSGFLQFVVGLAFLGIYIYLVIGRFDS